MNGVLLLLGIQAIWQPSVPEEPKSAGICMFCGFAAVLNQHLRFAKM